MGYLRLTSHVRLEHEEIIITLKVYFLDIPKRLRLHKHVIRKIEKLKCLSYLSHDFFFIELYRCM